MDMPPRAAYLIQYHPPVYWISVLLICLNVNISLPSAYIIMSISHPWPRATRKYASRGPHYVTLSPRAQLYRPLAASWGPRAT